MYKRDERGKAFISVAMCTFNGAFYLRNQLESIFVQTRLPDELVICDDCSSDETLQIIDEFKRIATFPVRVYRNKKRLGPTKNFEKAINQCSGDIIVLCDQDDVWMHNKLEELEKKLAKHKNAGYVFGDATVVDEYLSPLGYTYLEKISFTKRQKRQFLSENQLKVLLKHNVVMGATMAFRSVLKDLILPIPDSWLHDAWIAFLSSAVGKRGIFIKESFIKYRQHEKQIIGGKKDSFLKRFKEAFFTSENCYISLKINFIKILERLNSTAELKEGVKNLIEEKIQHLTVRQRVYELEGFRFYVLNEILNELFKGRYHKFSNGWISFMKDFSRIIIPGLFTGKGANEDGL